MGSPRVRMMRKAMLLKGVPKETPKEAEEIFEKYELEGLYKKTQEPPPVVPAPEPVVPKVAPPKETNSFSPTNKK